MASGGARTRSGPAPDPNALRRDRKSDGEWLMLPATREGDAPAWPLPTFTDRELEVWAELWSRPQAFAWELHNLTDIAALYTRRMVEAEEKSSAVALSTLVRQLRDDLGLSVDGMSRLRWRVASDETAKRRETAAAPKRSSSRDRMTVVNSDTA